MKKAFLTTLAVTMAASFSLAQMGATAPTSGTDAGSTKATTNTNQAINTNSSSSADNDGNGTMTSDSLHGSTKNMRASKRTSRNTATESSTNGSDDAVSR